MYKLYKTVVKKLSMHKSNDSKKQKLNKKHSF